MLTTAGDSSAASLATDSGPLANPPAGAARLRATAATSAFANTNRISKPSPSVPSEESNSPNRASSAAARKFEAGAAAPASNSTSPRWQQKGRYWAADDDASEATLGAMIVPSGLT